MENGAKPEKADDVKDYYRNQVFVPEEYTGVSLIVNECTREPVDIPKHVTEALAMLHEDILKKCFGCATAYPEALEGAKVLDLGCGAGKDCFVLSNLVGEGGEVVGVDMLEEPLGFARAKIQYHQELYGYASPNVSFLQGYMERMDQVGLKDNYFDVIVSNCVISLCKDKKKVLQEAARVLKPNGEMYFSDVYRKGDIPPGLMEDNHLWCEGVTGAMTCDQLNELADELGFYPPRVYRAKMLPFLDAETAVKLGDTKYASINYRLFKKPAGEPTPAGTFVYKGGIRGCEEVFRFDHNLKFLKDEAVSVDEDTATILAQSRYGQYFERTGPPNKDIDMSFQAADPFTIA